jgi:hypothetical protein
MGIDWKSYGEMRRVAKEAELNAKMTPMREAELERRYAAARRAVMGERGNARMAPKSVMLAEGFEGMAEALEAKRRLMTLWKGDGLDFTAAVLGRAVLQRVRGLFVWPSKG